MSQIERECRETRLRTFHTVQSQQERRYIMKGSKQKRETSWTMAATFWALVGAIGKVAVNVHDITNDSLIAILVFIIGFAVTLIGIACHHFLSRKSSTGGTCSKKMRKKKSRRTHR